MLRKIRIAIGLFVLCALTVYFLSAIESLAALPKLQFIPAMLAVNVLVFSALCILTLLFGRIYCSVFCPLGILQDVVNRLSRKTKGNKKRFAYSLPWTKLRYTFLAFTVLSLAFGLAIVPAVLDPYSIYGRLVTQLLSPVWLSINNLLAPISDRYEWYLLTKKAIILDSLEALLLSGFALLGIGYLSWKHGRLYCNTICPVGTVLGTLSKFSLGKIVIDQSNCNHCGLCAANCKASCIDSKNQAIDYSRCVSCFACLDACPRNALSFASRHSFAPMNKGSVDDDTAISRRQFITTGTLSMAGVVAIAAKTSASPFASATNEPASVLPPGARNAQHFSSHCTSCHLCISKCPSQVLKPLSFGYGMNRLLQPTMAFKRGYCEYDCHLCGTICPNKAIEQLTLEQKQHTAIGFAEYTQSRCVVETDEVNCGNCAVHCPTQAITMIDYKNSKKIPVVDTSRCIGCGSCEYHCPAAPGAIHVIGFEETHKVY